MSQSSDKGRQLIQLYDYAVGLVMEAHNECLRGGEDDINEEFWSTLQDKIRDEYRAARNPAK